MSPLISSLPHCLPLPTLKVILPSTANVLYKAVSDPTDIFRQMALYILTEMASRSFPLSEAFLSLLGEAVPRTEVEAGAGGEGQRGGGKPAAAAPGESSTKDCPAGCCRRGVCLSAHALRQAEAASAVRERALHREAKEMLKEVKEQLQEALVVGRRQEDTNEVKSLRVELAETKEELAVIKRSTGHGGGRAQRQIRQAAKAMQGVQCNAALQTLLAAARADASGLRERLEKLQGVRGEAADEQRAVETVHDVLRKGVKQAELRREQEHLRWEKEKERMQHDAAVREQEWVKEKQEWVKETAGLQQRSKELAWLRKSRASQQPRKSQTARVEAETSEPQTSVKGSLKERNRAAANGYYYREKAMTKLYEGTLQTSVQDLAAVLEGTDRIDALMETAPFWLRKIPFAQEVVDDHNRVWGPVLCMRMQAQYLIGQRDTAEMRYDFSHELINGRPRKRVAVINPHRPWDPKQRVFFAQPIPAEKKVRPLIREGSHRFGLIVPEAGQRDVTQRDFESLAQLLATRDEAQLARRDRVVLAFGGVDGASHFCHYLLRLVEYKEDIAVESEAKGMKLAIATKSDDHFRALTDVLGPRIAPAINKLLTVGTNVQLCGEWVPLLFRMGLDLSAACSILGRRSNASAHTEVMDPHLHLPVRVGMPWAEAKANVLKALPPLNVLALHLDAHAPHDDEFPFTCLRKGCCFTLTNKAEAIEYLDSLRVLELDRSKEGVKLLAKTISTHADLHGQQLPGKAPILLVPPVNNIVDYLHQLDINLGAKLEHFTWLDPIVMATRPDARESVSAYYRWIGCHRDLSPTATSSWFHGAVWHYDFVLGMGQSLGLKANVFMLNIIAYGITAEEQAAAAKTGIAVVNDIPGRRAPAKPAVHEEGLPTTINGFLRRFFGHNADRV